MPENIFNLKIFKNIERETILEIVQNCTIRAYNKGDYIIKQNEASNGEAYIIKSGSITVIIDGKPIKTLDAGEIFGEIALLNQELRNASIFANENLNLIVLSIDDLVSMINNDNSSISKTIVKRIEENLELA